MRSSPVSAPAVVAFVLATVVVASRWPLLTYSTSLALCGFAHVTLELRYVDGRFGRRFSASLWAVLFVPLAGIVALRGARAADALDALPHIAALPVTFELLLVGVMVACGGVLARAGRRPAAVGASLGLLFAALAIWAPIEGLLTMSLLHNLTPVGFIVERAPPARRAVHLAVSLAVFTLAPLAVALGVVDVVGVDLAAAFPSAGPLSEQLGVYLWPSWRTESYAPRLFGAAVCAQLLHYGAVIVWLPRALTLSHDPAPTRAPWPSWRGLVVAVAVLSLGLAAHFAVAFSDARTLYALPAAVHAWIELPILLVALTRSTDPARAG